MPMEQASMLARVSAKQVGLQERREERKAVERKVKATRKVEKNTRKEEKKEAKQQRKILKRGIDQEASRGAETYARDDIVDKTTSPPHPRLNERNSEMKRFEKLRWIVIEDL